jgi:hypothetical protein
MGSESPHATPDSELLACVTSRGEIPLECVGVVDGLIVTYLPTLGATVPMLIEDNRLAVECRSYLRRIGREFKSRTNLPCS